MKTASSGGVRYAIEMAGSPRAFDLPYQITLLGGTTASASLANISSAFEVSSHPLVAEERTIKGSYMASCIPSRNIPSFIKLYLAGPLPVDKYVSSTGPRDEINKAFDLLQHGEVIRHVILSNG